MKSMKAHTLVKLVMLSATLAGDKETPLQTVSRIELIAVAAPRGK